MNSVNEAICRGVPMLLLPHHFEQEMIARRVSEMGMGMNMNIKNISVKSLLRNSDRLITDQHFKNNASMFQSIFSSEEKVSHVKAADEILEYANKKQHIDQDEIQQDDFTQK